MAILQINNSLYHRYLYFLDFYKVHSNIIFQYVRFRPAKVAQVDCYLKARLSVELVAIHDTCKEP